MRESVGEAIVGMGPRDVEDTAPQFAESSLVLVQEIERSDPLRDQFGCYVLPCHMYNSVSYTTDMRGFARIA